VCVLVASDCRRESGSSAVCDVTRPSENESVDALPGSDSNPGVFKSLDLNYLAICVIFVDETFPEFLAYHTSLSIQRVKPIGFPNTCLISDHSQSIVYFYGVSTDAEYSAIG
jgi:hypothetical protein